MSIDRNQAEFDPIEGLTKEEMIREIGDLYERKKGRGPIIIDATGIMFSGNNNTPLLRVLRSLYKATLSINGTRFTTKIEPIVPGEGRILDLDALETETLRIVLGRVISYVERSQEGVRFKIRKLFRKLFRNQ